MEIVFTCDMCWDPCSTENVNIFYRGQNDLKDITAFKMFIYDGDRKDLKRTREDLEKVEYRIRDRKGEVCYVCPKCAVRHLTLRRVLRDTDKHLTMLDMAYIEDIMARKQDSIPTTEELFSNDEIEDIYFTLRALNLDDVKDSIGTRNIQLS